MERNYVTNFDEVFYSQYGVKLFLLFKIRVADWSIRCTKVLFVEVVRKTLNCEWPFVTQNLSSIQFDSINKYLVLFDLKGYSSIFLERLGSAVEYFSSTIQVSAETQTGDLQNEIQASPLVLSCQVSRILSKVNSKCSPKHKIPTLYSGHVAECFASSCLLTEAWCILPHD
jgi:hypothetical protein